MRQEVRNLKGEIVREASYGEPWWKFSVSTWILIAGLVMLSVGCFVDLEELLHLMDPRRWRWWYFVLLALVAFFSIRWVIIALRYEDYDADEWNAAKCFLRMSVFISALSGSVVLLHATEHLRRLTLPMEMWFTSGRFSGMAIVGYIVLLALFITVFHLIKEWLKTF